jgi:carbonic anhydrase/acetyltransferase-like protein (isoleucine patch superfamily)
LNTGYVEAWEKPKLMHLRILLQRAYVVGDTKLAKFAIWPVRFEGNSDRIGSNCSIQDNCVIHAGVSDVIIGNNVTIGHGSVIHCARIGDVILIGMHATLSSFSEIGDFSIIGAHSMVGDHFKVPPRSLAVGYQPK